MLAAGTLPVVTPASARAQSDRTLHFVQEPASPIDVGETFAVHVAVRDSDGNPDGGFGADVVVSLVGGAPVLL
ncbi:MAG TPA: hypothetical protein VEY33_09100, partial [Gemmatimonadota bacterium]|nr:hypothetical protein [Gemmatimonadota bacterium]